LWVVQAVKLRASTKTKKPRIVFMAFVF